MSEHKYALKYYIDSECKEGGYTKEDATEDNVGLCDAMAFISIIKPDDGSYSQVVLSMDGKTKEELTQNDLFKVWTLLGLTLANNNGLKRGRKELIDTFAEIIRSGFKRS